MAEDFQEVISEDINNLIEKKGCYFCFKKIEYITLGGFKTGDDNSLDLQNPICKTCWLKKNWQSKEGFLSLGGVLKEAKGELTDTVKIEWPEAIPIDDDNPQEPSERRCDHTYKSIGEGILCCQRCDKKVSIMGV